MFHRIIEDVSQSLSKVSEELWKDKTAPTQYRDYIIDTDKFVDSPSIVYACRMDAVGSFTVLKDTGLTAKMLHTFGGWPISAPAGKVVDLDPLAPKTIYIPIDPLPVGVDKVA
jgi:hypothetical protein